MQQMQWLSVVHILVLELVQSTWMMLVALAVRTTSLTALEALVFTVTVATQRMQECDVKVCTTDKITFNWSDNLIFEKGDLSNKHYVCSCPTTLLSFTILSKLKA